MRLADLKAALETGNEDEIVSALEYVAQRPKRAETVQLVKKLAAETRSAVVRNAAALALLDWQAPKTAQLMLELVARPETRGHRGTLLYVLNELNASVPLALILDVLAQDNYEARAEALALLAGADHPLGNVGEALPVLRRLTQSNDQEAAEHAREAIDILTSTN